MEFIETIIVLAIGKSFYYLLGALHKEFINHPYQWQMTFLGKPIRIIVIFLLIFLLIFITKKLIDYSSKNQKINKDFAMPMLVGMTNLYLLSVLSDQSIDIKSWPVHKMISRLMPTFFLLLAISITCIIIDYHVMKITKDSRKQEEQSNQTHNRNIVKILPLVHIFIGLWPLYYLSYMLYLELTNRDFGLRIIYLSQSSRIALLVVLMVFYAWIFIRYLMSLKQYKNILFNKSLLAFAAYCLALFVFRDSIFNTDISWNAIKVINYIVIALVQLISCLVFSYHLCDIIPYVKSKWKA